MIKEEIVQSLFESQDTQYRDFQSKLIPNIEKESIIGVRTPILRTLAKNYAKRNDISEFLNELPHKYFEENQLHAFIISQINDFDRSVFEVCRFLPFVDNWATCDQMSPKSFKKNKEELIKYIEQWLKSSEVYTVRFAVGMLMTHYLDEDFKLDYPDMAASIRSDEYYVNMMTAWYFATALAKHYDEALPYIKENKLDVWTHNKAVQKAVESRRITPEQKAYLKTLKRK